MFGVYPAPGVGNGPGQWPANAEATRPALVALGVAASALDLLPF